MLSTFPSTSCVALLGGASFLATGLSLLGVAETTGPELASIGAVAAGGLQLFLLQQLLGFRRELGELKGRVDSCQGEPLGACSHRRRLRGAAPVAALKP